MSYINSGMNSWNNGMQNYQAQNFGYGNSNFGGSYQLSLNSPFQNNQGFGYENGHNGLAQWFNQGYGSQNQQYGQGFGYENGHIGLSQGYGFQNQSFGSYSSQQMGMFQMYEVGNSYGHSSPMQSCASYLSHPQNCANGSCGSQSSCGAKQYPTPSTYSSCAARVQSSCAASGSCGASCGARQANNQYQQQNGQVEW